MISPTIEKRITRKVLAVTTGLLLCVPTSVLADEWPVLRKGLWEFSRSVDDGGGEPMKMSSKKCTEPGADMREQNERLKKSGCVFTPVVRSAKTYSFEATCKMRGIESRSKTVITVQSDSAYTAAIESTLKNMSTRERMVARRIGDC